MDTEAVWPAGTRAGVTALAQVIRYRVRLAARTDRTGRMISTPPMLSRVRWPSPRPSTPAAAPAATNALPRVVNPANIDRMRRPSSTLLFSTYGRADVHASGGLLSGGRPGAAQLGQRQMLDDRGQYVLRWLLGDHRLGARQQPVRQCREGQCLHVVRDDEIAAVQGGAGPASAQQVERGPRRGAQPQLGRGAG